MKCSTAGLPCYTAVTQLGFKRRATAVLKSNFIRSIDFGTGVARRLKRALQSFKTWTLSFKVSYVKPKEWRKSISLSLLWLLHEKKEKLSVMEKICLRLRVFYVRFANVRKSFLYEQNFLFGRNKPAEGRLFLKKNNVMH